MTNKEMKNIFVITMLALFIGCSIVIGIIQDISYSHDVDQFTYTDGTKITIDWSKSEPSEDYKNVTYYFGCINNGMNAQYWYMSAEQWYARVFEKDTECERTFGGPVKEWRW